MTRERAELVAALVRELRTPLARVALAAGELEALAQQPAHAELAQRIEIALRAADAGIERVLALLCARENTALAIDVESELARLRARIAPALAARGVTWQATAAPEPGVRIEATRLRRGALCLLRAGAGALDGGGWLRVSALRDASRSGLALECTPGPERGARLATLELRANAAALGASLELAPAADAARAELWFAA